MSSNSIVGEELEALKAILMDDISISYNEQGCAELVRSTIFPSTANEVEKQYVCVTLEIQLTEDYPDCKPLFKLKSPRGLDDSTIDRLYREIAIRCDTYKGQPIIYDLIELVRENLTQSNLPTCQCAVCLYGFSECDKFTKTQCFHYFHNYCLANHLIITEKHFNEEQEKLPAWKRSNRAFGATCPVCREQIVCDVDELKTALPPKEMEEDNSFEVSNDLKMLQEQMQALFIYQKSKGGIIDIEAEENRLLLVTNSSANDHSNDPGPSDSNNSQPGNSMENEVYSRNYSYSKYSSNR